MCCCCFVFSLARLVSPAFFRRGRVSQKKRERCGGGGRCFMPARSFPPQHICPYLLPLRGSTYYHSHDVCIFMYICMVLSYYTINTKKVSVRCCVPYRERQLTQKTNADKTPNFNNVHTSDRRYWQKKIFLVLTTTTTAAAI